LEGQLRKINLDSSLITHLHNPSRLSIRVSRISRSYQHIWIQWSRHAAFGSARLGSAQHDSEILSRCLARVRCVQKLPNALCEKDGRSISSDSNMHHWVVHISQTAASHASFFSNIQSNRNPESRKNISMF